MKVGWEENSFGSRYWSHEASTEHRQRLFAEQQNTSRAELNGTKDELSSVWGIMGHYNLQQMFKGHSIWNRNWTPHSYCNTVLQWFAVCTLWITNTFNFFCLNFIFFFFFFIIVAQYIYNKSNGMVIHFGSCGLNSVLYVIHMRGRLLDRPRKPKL